MTKRLMTMVAAAVLVGGLAAPASAQFTGPQDPPVLEFAVGYQLLHVGGDTGNTYPLGINFDGAWYRGPFGLVAELGWSRDSTEVPGASVSANYLHVGGGGRFLFVRDGQVRPHLQILGGVSRASFDSETDIPGLPPTSVESSDTAFMLQPGIGFTFSAGESVSFAASLDYRRGFFDEGTGLGLSDTNEVRFFLGVRFRLD